MANLLKDFLSYALLSKNKDEYGKIAKSNDVSPFYVYRLAHGRKAVHNNDWRILQDLKDRKIISGVDVRYQRL